MSLSGATILGDDPQILLLRFAEFVRPYPAKTLARMIGCSEKTATHFKNAESWPNARHWRLIARQFGRDVLAAVFDPEIDQTLARLRREERELEERLEELRSHRRQALGGLDGVSQRLPAAEDRSPLDQDLFAEIKP